jgi:pimeloyl-ACP methyl ester carboxylesterase
MIQGAVRVRGTRMAYREAGKGVPVLLIHGNTGSGLWFSRVMEIQGLRTIAPDMPNFGGSEAIGTADIDLYADHVLGFMDSLALELPVVVGHSLGGAVAISLAARNPARVGKLLLLDSCPVNGLVTPEEHYPAVELFKTNRALLKQGLQAVTPTLKDEALLDALVDEAQRMAPHAFAGNARALARFDYTGKTNAYAGPVLVAVGSLDVLVTRQMAEATARAFPRGRLEVMEGVGHSVIVEDPERFRALLAHFVGDLDAAEA